MIYTGQDSKPQPPKAQEQGPSRSAPGPAPPAYNETDNYRAIPPVQQPLFRPRPVEDGIPFVRPERASGRFFRTFGVAVGIWFLLSMFARTTVDLGYSRGGDWDSTEWKFDIPSTVDLHDCVQGAQWKPSFPLLNSSSVRYSAETSFTLPISSKTLFFLARGQQIGGAAQIKTSRDQPRDFANVHIVLHYTYERVLERIKACTLEREGDENGVGIFGPVYHRQPRWQYGTTYEIIITLPDSGRSSPLYINNFETDLPNSRHEIKDLSRNVLFNTISLKGSNGRIEAQSIKANDGRFKTSNGAISGVFETNTSLSLVTSNGGIGANVNLKSEKGSIPKLVAKTSNGAIEANFRLSSASGQGGAFDVTASTSNGLLGLKFPESPVDSKLDLDASTSNGRASVELNPAYEGSFLLSSSSSSSIVVDDNHKVEDPSGKKRSRTVSINQKSKGYVTGNISWDRNSEGHSGKVSVKTSNGPVYLGL